MTARIVIALLVAACGGDKARPSTVAPARVAPVQEVEMDRTKDADAVTRRFGVPVPAGPIPGRIGGSGGQVGKTAAPIMLVATHVSSDDQLSFATVVNKQTGGGGYYGVGDDIPAAGRVTRIAPQRIAYVDGGGETCTLDLIPEVVETPSPVSAGPTEVSRAELEAVLADPRSADARVQPSGSRTKLYAVRKGGLADRLGFRNGDIITKVAGVDLTDADTTGDAKRRDPSDPAGERSEPSRDAALAALQRARSSERVVVQVERDGATITLTFAVRD